ncbi:hypothetical protein BDV38DRAFT_280709 [Aspergillus pseudotamarii]|uniref:C2H2-type domain-containing protein n=1 Tax=Aspergillus pseudotamarii TaxID=132259 RepID=A0A5N6SYT2_ASPPS|nr:uncharacterized protein BDV38DRAFT_280709 [Aspergillus pseudotamarii]KAE8139792.1 hypothetical protein BDV38DRAFT_280709 [Aspergillus pseudotamarii]
MSLTYQEAWNLFQYEDSPQSLNTSSNAQSPRLAGNHTSPADPTVATNHEAESSNSELVTELRRLREDLQRLQFTGSQEDAPDVVPSMSNRSGSESAASQTTIAVRTNQASQKSDTLRCWESCCNGRVFSNRSNLIRHQRERRGESAKLRCSFCDAVFSRRAARDTHEAARRCRRL